MNSNLSKAILFLALASLVAMVGCAESSNSNTNAPTNRSTGANSNSSSANMTGNAVSSGDRDFMMKAAMGGMTEVEASKVAAQKSTNADVKKFAQRMIDDHTKAGNELTALASQKSVTLPSTLDQTHKDNVDKISKLSGAAFDKEYMSMMVKDHQDTVADFEHESSGGENTDLKAWTSRTLPTLREHLQMAQDTAGKLK
jgi:putative membrane protein